MDPKNLLILTLSIPFLAAALTPIFYKYVGRRKGLALPLAGALLPLLLLFGLVKQSLEQKTALVFNYSWVDSIGLGLSFTIDGFGGLFALLVCAIGVLIVWYAHHYMEHEQGVGRFFGFLLFFLGSMVGVCLGEHMFTLFFFWELTSISSFLLIGFWFEKDKSRAGALKALVITSGGGLAMMAGFALLGAKTDIWTWTGLSAVAPSIVTKPWATWALLLILIGAFTKSAQFPFHIWLPDAMEAPTPVSAFLHSATMVKAGIILLYRIYPIFSDHALWFPLVTTIGMITVVVGAVLALKHTDLKAILAYSTISQLGLFVAMHGMASSLDIIRAGLIFHIFAHAFYKGALFMLVGIIDHGTYTRDIRLLGKLKEHMPKTTIFVLLASGSLAGLPPFLGFISKESAIDATLRIAHTVSGLSWLLPFALVVSATLTVAVAGKIALGVFFANPKDPKYLENNKPHEASFGLLFSPALLACCGLLFGLAPVLLEGLLYPFGMIGLEGFETPHFALWHGLNIPLLLSTIAVVGGGVIYHFRDPIQIQHEKLKLGWNLNTLYEKKWDVILDLAKKITDRIQNGSLSQYVSLTVGFLGLLLSFVLVQKIEWSQLSFAPSHLFSFESLVALGICATCVMIPTLKDRIAKIISLGATGLLLCIYFVLRGAPDLALTGFLVEIVMFVLILVIFNQLEEEKVPAEKTKSNLFKIGLASLGGLTIGTIVFLVLKFPLGPSIASYFVDKSATLAGGLNIVNVIVVDFRGFDTMGEIAVVCLAGMGVFALRKVWSAKKEYAPTPRELKMRSLPPSQILNAVSGVVFPLILIFSFYMTLRGHNQPGGGFIGGLITAGALILELLVVGRNRFLKAFPIEGRFLYVLGLGMAFITGLIPVLFGLPFLTSYVFESIHFSTAAIFDLGVYLVVVGATLEIIVVVEESERRESV